MSQENKFSGKCPQCGYSANPTPVLQSTTVMHQYVNVNDPSDICVLNSAAVEFMVGGVKHMRIDKWNALKQAEEIAKKATATPSTPNKPVIQQQKAS
jgi:hypothetical protein